MFKTKGHFVEREYIVYKDIETSKSSHLFLDSMKTDSPGFVFWRSKIAYFKRDRIFGFRISDTVVDQNLIYLNALTINEKPDDWYFQVNGWEMSQRDTIGYYSMRLDLESDSVKIDIMKLPYYKPKKTDIYKSVSYHGNE